MQDSVPGDTCEWIVVPRFNGARRHDVRMASEAEIGSICADTGVQILDQCIRALAVGIPEGKPLARKTETRQRFLQNAEGAGVGRRNAGATDQRLGEFQRIR